MGLRSLSLVSLVLTTALAAGCGHPGAVSPQLRSGPMSAQAAPGELVVRFKSALRPASLQTLGLRTLKRIPALDAVVVKAADPLAALAALKADPAVAYAEPNYLARAIGNTPTASLLGDDDLLPELWGMAKIEAPAAWGLATGRGVTVAVVDTGIAYNHPDLAGRVAKGRDFINNDDDAYDDHGHGTHCAGTIGAGLGDGGVVGVAPGVSLLAVKVLSGSGTGGYDGVASGIMYAADQGAAVISMSLAGPDGSQLIDDAVAYAQARGSLVVAAMGNENAETPSYPAAAPGVLAVGATTSADKRSSFSNYGQHISVCAPGTAILSTAPGGRYTTMSGTSMATPHVAGLAALLKSRFPALDAAGLRLKIERSADDLGANGFDKQFGHGRINARKALAN